MNFIKGVNMTKEELLTYKWCLFLRYTLKGMGAKAAGVDSLIKMALTQPEALILCKTLEEAEEYAWRAYFSIKFGEYLYLRYDPKHNAIVDCEDEWEEQI